MLIIEDSVIYLTRGDSANLEIDLANASGETYVMGENDTLTLTLRTLPDASSPVLMSITGNPGSFYIPIRPEDTQDLEVGEYSADVQLHTADGGIYTVWPELEGRARKQVRNYKNFVIMSEVTIP